MTQKSHRKFRFLSSQRFIQTNPRPFTSIPSVATCMLRRQNWVVTTENYSAQGLKDELRRKPADCGLRKELLDKGPTHAESQYKNSGDGRETGNKMERWHQRDRDQILWTLYLSSDHTLPCITSNMLLSSLYPNICKFLKTRQCFLAVNQHIPHPPAWSGSLWTFFLPPFQNSEQWFLN